MRYNTSQFSSLILQMLQLAIMAQTTDIRLADRRIVLARVPHSLDHLRKANVVGLELVKPPHHEQRRDVQRPVEELAEAGVLACGEVVGYT
jgi:hypothetical protein